MTDSFTALAHTLAKSTGYPDLAMVVVKHPIGGLKKTDVGPRMVPVVQELLDALTLDPAELLRRAGDRTVGGFRPPRPRLAAGPNANTGGSNE